MYNHQRVKNLEPYKFNENSKITYLQQFYKLKAILPNDFNKYYILSNLT